MDSKDSNLIIMEDLSILINLIKIEYVVFCKKQDD